MSNSPQQQSGETGLGSLCIRAPSLEKRIGGSRRDSSRDGNVSHPQKALADEANEEQRQRSEWLVGGRTGSVSRGPFLFFSSH